MPKKFEHTAGPWSAPTVGKTTQLVAPYNERTDYVLATTEDDKNAAHFYRAVSCVNGCDAAGIVEPDALLELVNAAARLLADCDEECSGDHLDISAALRAVRGEYEIGLDGHGPCPVCKNTDCQAEVRGEDCTPQS